MTKKIWDTKGQYYTLDELCQFGYHTLLGDSAYTTQGVMPPYNGFEAIKELPALRKTVEQKLAELGLRRFSYLGNGDFAIVLKTIDDQVVRISVDSEENKRPKHPAILQPHATYLLSDDANKSAPVIRLEILKQVKDKNGKPICAISTNGIKPEHSEILKSVLTASGLDPHDLAEKNIALMSDGTPIVIDGGAVEHKPGKQIIIDEHELSRWLAVDQNGKVTWKQFVLYPEIEKGEITGGVTPKDIDTLKHLLGEDSQTYQAALEDGLYRAELGQLIIDASAAREQALASGKTVSFRESFKSVRDTYDKRTGPKEDWPKIR